MTVPASGTAVAGGRYQLGAVLGVGGMARVVRATDTLLARQVAVKLFRDDLDPEGAARARQEMQMLAALTHPGLVAVYDAGIETYDDGSEHPFLVMELVDGPTLAGQVLDPARAAVVGAQVADALAHVHAAGVVHRDVKPANILLAPDGSARLADFGIARIVDGARHTGTGLTIGTAPYLSPEQVTGAGTGPPADVYALGLVLLEVLTGHREFDGGPVETAMARLHRDPAVPGDLAEPWPALLRAMTAQQPGTRPSAVEVAAALRSTMPLLPPTSVLPAAPDLRPTVVAAAVPGPAPTGARPVPLVARRSPARRSLLAGGAGPLLAGLAVLVAVLVLVALAVSAVSGSGSGSSPTPPPGAPGPSRLDADLSYLQKAVTP